MKRSKVLLNKKRLYQISEISLIVSNALSEDIGSGDITCESTLNVNPIVVSEIVSKHKNIVVCGLNVVKEVFAQVDPKIRVAFKVKEGAFLKSCRSVCEIKGPAISVMKAERTALNFLGRLSGIATKTAYIASKVKKFKAKVLDTRKTTPGLRILEKYAVKTGGGTNHRLGLYDQVLIKDNHIRIVKNSSKKSSLYGIILKVRSKVPKNMIIEIETAALKQVSDAVMAKPDIILLDNMSLADMRKAVKIRDKVSKKTKLEASGNITEKNIAKVAACGVDFISIGALTHSVECVDFSLRTK